MANQFTVQTINGCTFTKWLGKAGQTFHTDEARRAWSAGEDPKAWAADKDIAAHSPGDVMRGFPVPIWHRDSVGGAS